MHAILYAIYAEDVRGFATAHPMLHESICAIYVHHKPNANKLDEAVENLTVSARGNVHRKASVVQIVIMCQKLVGYGFSDTSALVKKWNQKSGRADAIIGKKLAALRLLLDVCPKDPSHIICIFSSEWQASSLAFCSLSLETIGLNMYYTC